MGTQTRQILIPLPTVPSELSKDNPALVNFLLSLNRSVEANLNALFATDYIHGQRLSPGSVDTLVIAEGAITATEITDLSITTPKLAANAVTAAKIYANTITASQIASDTITASEIHADAITGSELAATSVNTGHLVALAVDTGQLAAQAVTAVKIKTGDITTTQLAFTPLYSSGTTGAIVATINASIEGITIDADNITISGSTTFSAGYDPTDYVDELGGSYDSASSGARVRIFPDANTGIQIIDDAAGDVFVVLVGGADVGDVIIGDYAGDEGCKWDKSAGTFSVRGSLNADDISAGSLDVAYLDVSSVFATDIEITGALYSTGKTTYADIDQGFWLGIDGGVGKLNIGDGTEFLKWDGFTLVISGDITTTDLTNGTIDNGVVDTDAMATGAVAAIATAYDNSLSAYIPTGADGPSYLSLDTVSVPCTGETVLLQASMEIVNDESAVRTVAIWFYNDTEGHTVQGGLTPIHELTANRNNMISWMGVDASPGTGTKTFSLRAQAVENNNSLKCQRIVLTATEIRKPD